MVRHGKTADGKNVALKFFGQSSFAEFALANERNTIKVRKDAPLELLGPFGCGIQTGAGTILNGLKPKMGSSIAIIGCGSVGLSGLLASVVSGCTTIIAVDVVESRLQLARSLGATHVVNGKSDAGLEAEIRKIVPDGVNYILDTTALPSLVRAAANSLSLRGHLGLVGVPRKMDEVFTLDVIRNLATGVTIQYFLEGDSVPQKFIPALVDLYMQGKFPVDKLVTYYPFDQINEAVSDQLSGRVTKPILRLNTK
jgi:aryl-alcohol dehydrogenase